MVALLGCHFSFANNFDSRPDHYLGSEKLNTGQNVGMCAKLSAISHNKSTPHWEVHTKDFKKNDVITGKGYALGLTHTMEALTGDEDKTVAGEIYTRMNCKQMLTVIDKGNPSWE